MSDSNKSGNNNLEELYLTSLSFSLFEKLSFSDYIYLLRKKKLIKSDEASLVDSERDHLRFL